ncbi:Vms1/Ankzf1 family peptidyl-tRNA hydrolase [Cellulomonas sp. NPDC089187]|uniref:baeRF2 domain-containing protein n=1 Tax=Cellulomonas sp. NPDC089187 TaxID=3154970 RepID=UPI00342166E2
MDLHWLKPLLGRPGPFITVLLDATRADASGDEEVAGRWKSLRRELAATGAQDAVLDVIEERVTRPTGVAGPHGRVVIADGSDPVEIVVDRTVKEPPAQSSAVYDAVPALAPAVRAADQATRFLLVEIDRQGADLTWSNGTSARPQREVVEGDHDVVHKIREGGGWSHRRMQTRAEDSWERNAETVAADLDRQVAERHPEIVLLTGDVRAVSLLKDAVGQHVRELIAEVPGGSRADGVNQQAFEEHVAAALFEHRARRREKVLDRFRTAQGRGEAAVTSVPDLVTVLQRGQVAELLVRDDLTLPGSALSERRLHVGPEPLQVAVDADDLIALGTPEGSARVMPADAAILRAALGQDAGLTLVPDGAADLVDGVGAILRWVDESTPSEAVPSQSADQARLRDVV